MSEEHTRYSVPFRAISLVLALCLLALSTGCAGGIRQPATATLPRLLEPEERPAPAGIQPVVADGESTFGTHGYSRGRCKGAAVGAGRAVGKYLGGALSGDCDGGVYCGVYAFVVVLFAPVVAIGGAIAGAAGSVSKKDVKKMNAFLEQTMSESGMERTLVEEIGADLAAGAAAATVLEIGPVDVRGFAHGGNTPVRWRVATRAKLVRRSDGAVLQSGSYSYHGGGRKLREWVRNDLAALRAELRSARRSLGEKIADEFLLLDPVGRRAPLQPPEQSDRRRGNKPRLDDPPDSFYGLRPIQPPALGPHHKMRANGLPRYAFTRVAAGSLTFRWEALETIGADADRARNVTYEIRIAKAEGGVPGHVVYRREGLSEPEHTVQGKLVPGAEYFWTVRARFEVDGRVRVTEWGGIHSLSRLAAEVPNVHSYRFKVGH